MFGPELIVHPYHPMERKQPFRAHAFEYACAQLDIDHRLTNPWTNGQAEWTNWTLKDATVKRYFFETHDQCEPI